MARAKPVVVEATAANVTTVIKHCNCANPGQDKLHGVGNRVFNMDFSKGLNCTVCGANYKYDKPKK